MFALRERRQHVTQEDFEMAVSKVMKTLGVISVCGCVPSCVAGKLLSYCKERFRQEYEPDAVDEVGIWKVSSVTASPFERGARCKP